MDFLTRFWEKQAVWIAKIEGVATLIGIVGILLAAFTAEKGKAFGFVMGIVGMWGFGVRMVYELWYVDEYGYSKARGASPFMRFIGSAFYLVSFIGLAFITVVFGIVIFS